jgi:pimeloyl-ACP methyl ester carboxylesterase
LTTPYFIWDKTFPDLIKAGFRVLRYDHYGRGFSDRPRAVYGYDLYDTQLLELIKGLKLKTPLHLVGLSMGGAVSVIFTDRYPDLVSRVCLISPISFPHQISTGQKLAKVPLLGESVMAVAGDSLIKKGVLSSLYKMQRFPEFMEKFEIQLIYRGYVEAILSTLRNISPELVVDAFRQVGKQKRPMMLIWGKDDEILPFSLSRKVKEVIPHIEFHSIDKAGHSSHYEKPEAINPLIVEFLEK